MIPHAFAEHIESMACSLNVLAGAAISQSITDSSRDQHDVEGALPYHVYPSESRLTHRKRALYDEDDPMLMPRDHQDYAPITYKKQGYMPFHRVPADRKTDRKNRSSYESICNDPSVVAPSFSVGGSHNSKGFQPRSEKTRDPANTYYTTGSSNARSLPDEPSALPMRPQMHYAKDGAPSYLSKGHLSEDSHFEHDQGPDQPSFYTHKHSAFEHDREQTESMADSATRRQSYHGESAVYYTTPQHSHNPSAGHMQPHAQPEQPVEYSSGHKAKPFAHHKQETQGSKGARDAQSNLAAQRAYNTFSASIQDRTALYEHGTTEDSYVSSRHQMPDKSDPTYNGHDNLSEFVTGTRSSTHSEFVSDSYTREQRSRHSTMPDQAYGYGQASDSHHSKRRKTCGSLGVAGPKNLARMQFHQTHAQSFTAGNPQPASLPLTRKFIFVTETGQKKHKEAKTKASTPSNQSSKFILITAAVENSVRTSPSNAD